jgi:hypothetical protein
MAIVRAAKNLDRSDLRILEVAGVGGQISTPALVSEEFLRENVADSLTRRI